MRPITLSLLLAFAVTLAGGCSKTYQVNAFDDAQSLSDDQVAILIIQPSVRFISLDGQSVPGIPTIEGNGPVHRNRSDPDKRIIRILPGTHRVVAGYAPFTDEGGATGVFRTYEGSFEDEEVEFDAVAGKKYFVQLDVSGDLQGNVLWNACIFDQGPLGLPLHIISRSIRRIDHATGAIVPPDQQMRPKRAFKKPYQ